MSKHLLSSLVAAVLAAAPAMLAQTPGQRETDKTDKSKTQDQSQTESRDRVRSGEQASGTAQLRNNERQFLMEAAQDSLVEIELGKLAQERASNPEVKEFGERMVEDHTKALEKLKETASNLNVTIPSELSAKHNTTVDRFSKPSGDEFDRAYMKHMVQDHKKAVNRFEKTAKNAQNADVKNLASETAPTLREHLEQAQKINTQISAKGTASRQRDASQTDTEQQEQDKTDPADTPKKP
jgi:putative membrane protein